MAVPICPPRIPHGLAFYAPCFPEVLGYRLIAYFMAGPEKCFENVEDEETTWSARCSVVSGCRKSPEERLKVPVNFETGTFTDKGSSAQIYVSFIPPCSLENGTHCMSELIFQLQLFILDGIMVQLMSQTT